MIFPRDYRQRILKQEKSRQYKAMLDEQIRQNNIFNQEKNTKRGTRIRTEPTELYSYKNYRNSNAQQIPHQSTFLPSIGSSNIIDHQFKYSAPVHDYTSNRRFYGSQKHKSFKGVGNDQSDGQLQKCLQQCDELIYGINKNFIHLNNHLGRNSHNPNKGKNFRSKNYSQFQVLNDSRDSDMRNYPSILRPSDSYQFSNDVGRNQMMNYNLGKAKQKQILHISTPTSAQRSSSTSIKNDKMNDFMAKSGQKTKRKNNNLFDPNSLKTPTNKKGKNQFDTINSDQQNEFSHSMDKSMLSDMSGSVLLDKMKNNGLSKRQIEKLQAHMQMKKKDTSIIEHLRKAKNRGSLLFKKIQMFKKQRQSLQQKSVQKGSPQTSKINQTAQKSDKSNIQSKKQSKASNYNDKISQSAGSKK